MQPLTIHPRRRSMMRRYTYTTTLNWGGERMLDEASEVEEADADAAREAQYEARREMARESF